MPGSDTPSSLRRGRTASRTNLQPYASRRIRRSVAVWETVACALRAPDGGSPLRITEAQFARISRRRPGRRWIEPLAPCGGNSKTADGATRPWVRIPPPPPHNRRKAALPLEISFKGPGNGPIPVATAVADNDYRRILRIVDHPSTTRWSASVVRLQVANGRPRPVGTLDAIRLREDVATMEARIEAR